MKPTTIYMQGFEDLIPVLVKEKRPALKGWNNAQHTLAEVEAWTNKGYNTGMLARNFPGLDCDVDDPMLCHHISAVAREHFGNNNPTRIRDDSPRWLMIFRTTTPIKKQRMTFKDSGGNKHAVELLGDGQQYLVSGTHPSGSEYEYMSKGRTVPLGETTPEALTNLALAKVEEFWTLLRAKLTLHKCTDIEQGGATTTSTRPAEELVAPSWNDLVHAVQSIPNVDRQREFQVEMAHAIRGAAPDNPKARALFLAWSAQYEDANSTHDEKLWDTIVETRIGWGWIRSQAESNMTTNEVTAIASAEAQQDFAPVREKTVVEVEHEDTPDANIAFTEERTVAWLTEQLQGLLIRSGEKDWFKWDGNKWAPIHPFLARDCARTLMREVAETLRAKYPESDKLEKKLNIFTGEAYFKRVWSAVSDHAGFFVERDTMNGPSTYGMLNTPTTLWDLRKDMAVPSDPSMLITQSTKVDAVVGSGCPVWESFLRTSTGGDPRLYEYLRLVLGSTLHAGNQDRLLWFIVGESGAGKSTLQKHMTALLGSYGGTLPQNALIHGSRQAHETSTSMLRDKRFIHASEIDRGQKWNIQLLKSVTGNEPITARRMYREHEDFTVVGKFLISGNETPTLSNADSAVRNRLRILRFTLPDHADPLLDKKIADEYPAILAWLLDAAYEWYLTGYPTSEAVDSETQGYFEAEDIISEFLNHYFLVTGNDEHFVAYDAVWELWETHISRDVRKDMHLNQRQTLAKAVQSAEPKRIKTGLRKKVNGVRYGGMTGLQAREGVLNEFPIHEED